MARIPITVMGFRCERCSHEWIPRNGIDSDPAVCPSCKNPYWNKPRKKAMMTYERFSETIRKTLETNGGSLTWTEIRTTAKLPQAFPNNQWVHRMEADIGLVRVRDAHGIIHWQLGRGLDVDSADATSKPTVPAKRPRQAAVRKPPTLE